MLIATLRLSPDMLFEVVLGEMQTNKQTNGNEAGKKIGVIGVGK
jgi:phosphoglycerate dehydrogenase-like enzyme